jgi:hypothetical protein
LKNWHNRVSLARATGGSFFNEELNSTTNKKPELNLKTLIRLNRDREATDNAENQKEQVVVSWQTKIFSKVRSFTKNKNKNKQDNSSIVK